MSELCDAVARLDVEQVKQLLALGHDPNGVRRLWWDDENDDELQPSRPLKMVVFRLSDCTHTEIENDALAQIARALLDAGADPHNALQLAEARYGDCSDSPWEAMQMVVKAAAATSAASKGSPAAAEASEGELTASTTGAKTIDSLYPDSFTVMSYNVLIPNSKDGWWIYKMYRCDTPHEDTEWPARQKLLQKQLLDSGADIICLQEMAGWSIDEDWEFLKEAGYDCAVYKKDRMRCVNEVQLEPTFLVTDLTCAVPCAQDVRRPICSSVGNFVAWLLHLTGQGRSGAATDLSCGQRRKHRSCILIVWWSRF